MTFVHKKLGQGIKSLDHNFSLSTLCKSLFHYLLAFYCYRGKIWGQSDFSSFENNLFFSACMLVGLYLYPWNLKTFARTCLGVDDLCWTSQSPVSGIFFQNWKVFLYFWLIKLLCFFSLGTSVIHRLFLCLSSIVFKSFLSSFFFSFTQVCPLWLGFRFLRCQC